tara:strand:- start:1444 stop:2718 length:1275 start_codon:yes stop_codon:yes gene_type:complete
MALNIYNANGKTMDIIEMNKLQDYYNKNEDITSKTNQEITEIQNQNKEIPQRYLKQIFSISFAKRALFFKPRMSDWGTTDLNIPLQDDELKELLLFGENFKNYLFNNCLQLTGKMPECIEMGIDDSQMKHKLKFRESMPEYDFNEEELEDEKYYRPYNLMTVKKTEKYGTSPTMSIQIQQISLLKDIYNNEYPSYFDGNARMTKLINENNRYLVSDFKFLTKDGPKEKSYNFVKFLNIKKLTLDLQQDLDQETKESKISELEKIIIEFDSEHLTYERLMTYMLKRKRNTMLGLEAAPTKLLLSNYKFEKLYKENPLYEIEEYLEGNVFWNKNQEYIVGKKELDRDGKVSISKSKKSRYDFYMKLIVFDETDAEEKSSSATRPDYYSRSSEVKSVDEPEPEPESEEIITSETIEDVEVIDSDDEQ